MGKFSGFAPSVEKVRVRGVSFDVTGIGVRDLFLLFEEFPEIARLVDGNTIDPKKLRDLSDAAVNAIIAAACGARGIEEEEKGIAALALNERVKFLNAIWRQTVRDDDTGPFVELFGAIVGMMKGEAPADAEGAQRIKVRSTKSRKPPSS